MKAARGSAICNGSSSTTASPVVGDTELDRRARTTSKRIPAASKALVGRDPGPAEHEGHAAVGQVEAHRHLAATFVGPVAQPEEPAQIGVGVVDVEVHGLVEVGLGAQLVHVLVFGIEAEADAAHPMRRRGAGR